MHEPYSRASTALHRPIPGGAGLPQGSNPLSRANLKWALKWAKMCRVYDHLYTGGAIALTSRLVYDAGITFIVNATVEAPTLLLPGIECMEAVG